MAGLLYNPPHFLPFLLTFLPVPKRSFRTNCQFEAMAILWYRGVLKVLYVALDLGAFNLWPVQDLFAGNLRLDFRSDPSVLTCWLCYKNKKYSFPSRPDSAAAVNVISHWWVYRPFFLPFAGHWSVLSALTEKSMCMSTIDSLGFGHWPTSWCTSHPFFLACLQSYNFYFVDSAGYELRIFRDSTINKLDANSGSCYALGEAVASSSISGIFLSG